MSKKLISLFLALAFIFVSCQFTFAEGETEYNIGEQSLTIEEGGRSYKVTGTTAANTITIGKRNDDGSFKSITVNLTLDNVNITSSSTAINIYPNATVNLNLVGENVLTSTGSKKSGLCVSASGNFLSKVIIDGSGSLTVSSGANAAGIGAQNGASGEIVINGGRIHATSGTGTAAAIGGMSTNATAPITINGGYIKVSGTRGIGGGSNPSSWGKIEINGGSIVEENVTNTWASLGYQPKNRDGDNVFQITLAMPETSLKNKDITINGWKTTTDNSAKIYPYVTEDTTSIAAKGVNGEIYFCKNMNISTTKSYKLTEYTGDPCSCTAGTASISLDKIASSAFIDIIKKQATVALNGEFIPNGDCSFPLHCSGADITYRITDKDNPSSDMSNIAEILGRELIIYEGAVGKTLELTATAENNSITYTKTKDISVSQSEILECDLSDGNVTITNADEDNLNVSVGSFTCTVPKTKEIKITQKTASTENVIEVSADAKIILNNINISTTVNSAFTVSNCRINLKLERNNKLTSSRGGALHSLGGSSVNISGDGSLNTTSYAYAGISGFANVVIDSGTIKATGGTASAGIGGSNGVAGSHVEINGGKVTAVGQGMAACIGGGSGGNGGDVVINGGTVIAVSDDPEYTGFGIGGATNSSNHGTITINGGSVNAKMGAVVQNNKHLCKLSGIEANKDIEYTIGDSEDRIKASTDSNGFLYLYLSEGENKIKAFCDGTTYYERINIQSGTNEGKLDSNPETKITELIIAGEKANINDDTGKITITLPSNLDLTQTSAQIKKEGYDVQASTEDLSELVVEYIVRGKDGVSEKKYTLTITVIDAEENIFDITKNNISITSYGIEYGNDIFSVNPNDSIIITGETDKNVLLIESGEDIGNIIFRDLHIKSTSNSTPAIEMFDTVNITIEGDNVIESTKGPAIAVYDNNNINITGKGNLKVVGGASNPAISFDSNNKELNIISDAEESGKIILEGGTGYNAVQNGIVKTNSTTNIKIIDKNTKTTVKYDSTELYSVKVIVPAIDAQNQTCKYQNKIFTLDADKAFYLMLPEGNTDIELTYDGGTYMGTVNVGTEATSVTLLGEQIDNINVISPSTVTYKGGKVTFELQGIIDENRTKVQIVPNNDDFQPLDANVTVEDNKYIAVVDLPENTSGTVAVEYTIKGLINNKTVYTSDTKLILPINDTYCRITKFEIAGSNSDTVILDQYGMILVNFPFDHVLAGRYTPLIEHEGAKIETESGLTNTYFGADDNGEVKAVYKVTAKNNRNYKTYTVTLTADQKPKITDVSFDKTPGYEGGIVTVKIEGEALGYIISAEKEENRIVTVSVGEDQTVIATAKKDDKNKCYYTAEIEIAKNNDTTAKTHNVCVKIGSDALNISKTVQLTQSKGLNNNANIKSISIANQITGVVTGAFVWTILMPFDANLASLTPTIVLEDKNASYTPKGAQDFTSGTVKYTVTAQNGTDKTEYNVSVSKQAEPVAKGVSFTAPTTGAVDSLDFTVDGDNLENIEAAISKGKIVVKCEPQGGGTAITGTAVLKNGKYVATLTGLSNNDTTADKLYTVSVEIAGKAQTLTGGNPTLTIPRRKSDSCDIVEFKLIDGQTDLFIGEDTITLNVPYNTDLRSLTPQITLEDSKGSYSDAAAKKNFENNVTYTVTSESGKTKTYTVSVSRAGQAGVTAAAFEQPLSTKPGDVVITLTGNFINNLGDEITVTATPTDGGDAINAVINYTEYSGTATATLSLPNNEEETEKKYTVSVKLNGTEQTILNNEIVVPAKKPCSIISFKVGDVVAVPDDDNKITLKVPYATDLKKITPIVTIEGDHYEPTGERDFTNTVTYTVYEGDDTKTYEVMITRDGKPSINAVTIKNAPTSSKGGQVTVELEGVFWDSAKVKVIAPDNTSKDVTMTINDTGKASAVVSVGTNNSLTDAAEYTLEFYLDGSEEKIENAFADKITVPAKKPCSISSVKVGEVVGIPDDDNKITLKVPYATDLTKITPEIEIEGESCTPASGIEQDFTIPVTYTVTEGDDTETYEVMITRDGKPSISAVTLKNTPTSSKGGKVTVELDGVFWDSAKIKAVPANGGSAIDADMTVSEMGKAVAELTIPANESETDNAEYTLEFYLDGFKEKIEHELATKIVVPRRSMCEITSFKLPEQKGETRFEGTDIYIEVPYFCDLTSVVPIMEYRAETISPSADTPQDFSDTAKPVTYTLSSGTDTETYTVHITYIGTKPQIKRFTVEKQTGETVYDGDTIKIVMPSSANLKEIKPAVEFEGTDYSPKDAQDFSNSSKEPVIYTVVDEFGTKTEYKVIITKKRRSSSSSSYVPPTPTPKPTAEPTVKPTVEPTVEPTQTPAAQIHNKKYISGYEEKGTVLFRPDANITRAEIATIISILDESFDEFHEYEASFNDVNPDMWYANYINFAVSKGCISGYEDGTCRPGNMITRAEFASLIARYIGIDAPAADNLFVDIDSFGWCRNEINALARAGILNGYDNNEFKPEKFVTRAETVTIINRIFDRKMTDDIADKLTCPFSDITSAHWAYNDVLLAACEY